MTTLQSRLALLLLLGLASCGSTTLHARNRGLLETSRGSIDEGRYRESIQRSEDVLIATNLDAGTYRLQRFFAAHLISRAHAEAAFAAPFLTEPKVGTQFSLSGDDTSRGPSPTAHLVAASWWADWARQWYAEAQKAALEVDGAPVLPPSLAEFGSRNALAHANLISLAVYSRLDFQDKVADILRGIPDLGQLAGCDALLEEARIPDAARAWIYAGVFEQLTESDHREAYRFGIRARLAAAESAGSFSAAHRKAIADWILLESDFVFRSPSGSVFDPNLEGCTVDGTPNLEYIAVRREPRP